MGKKKKNGRKKASQRLQTILLVTAILNTITAAITLIIAIMQLV